MQDRIRVCQWGAFDVANYGDQVFPLVAKEQLAARIPNLDLVCFAPLGHASLPPGSPPLFPLVPGGGPLDRHRRAYFAEHFDAVLIGGGDLLRFDPSEPGYDALGRQSPAQPYDPFLDFRWGDNRPDILWNAPGVPFPFEPSRRLLVRRALSQVRYAAVRDEVSKGYLLEAGVEGNVEVVPDNGVLLAETIRSHASLEATQEKLGRRGSFPDARGRLCFQCSPGFLRNRPRTVAAALANIARRQQLEIVLLPVGVCHNDVEALRSIQDASSGRFTLLEDVVLPLEMGAVIGACDYFVGSSLHGNLTALSFGLPHVVVNNPVRAAKLEGYVEQAGVEDFRITDWDDLEPCFERLAAAPRKDWVKKAESFREGAGKHFDRLADLITTAAARRRGAGPRASAPEPDSSSRGDDSAEAYDTIAALHERLEDERDARRETEQELERSKATIHERHLAHIAQQERAEVRNKRLEDRIEQLTAQSEQQETEIRALKALNLASVDRLQEIEESTIWRLFGPYRWLRSVLNGRTRGR